MWIPCWRYARLFKHIGVCSPFCNDNDAVLVTVYNICTLIYIMRFILSIISNDFTPVTIISILFDTLTYSSFSLSVCFAF
jgi:hypothetical protein